MSALRDVADHVGTPQNCTICGTSMSAGGMWRGATDIFICGPSCASHLHQVALDTLLDTNGFTVSWADWMRMAASEYDRWERGKRVQQSRAFAAVAGRSET
jgi:hypothetical protein